MKIRYRIETALQMLAFAFYPKTTLVVCAVFTVIVLVILGVAMMAVPKDSHLFNILFALTTGAVASFLVSIVVELSGNYKSNKLAWYELQEYYAAVTDYEDTKNVYMQKTPLQMAKKQALDAFLAEGGAVEEDEEEVPKDELQVVWLQLYKLIPVLKITYKEKKGYLEEREIWALRKIVSAFDEIQNEIKTRLMLSPMLYHALNRPKLSFLEGVYPKNILEDMPDWMEKHLASEESQKAIDRLAQVILLDSFLLSQFFEGYDISRHGLDCYEETDQEGFLDLDSILQQEPTDEESYQNMQDQIDQELVERNKPFVSWHISQCCAEIAKEMEELEKSILRKPYYSLHLKLGKKLTQKRKAMGPVCQRVYEAEKTRLEKTKKDV